MILLSDREQRKMPNYTLLKQLKDSLNKALPNARINPVSLMKKLILTIDAAKAAEYGLNSEIIAISIKKELQQQKLGNFQATESTIPIVLTAKNFTSIRNMLDQTFIKGKEKQEIPLSAIIKISYQQDYKYITAGFYGEYYPLNINSENAKNDLKIVQPILKTFEKDIDINISGSFLNNQALLDDMFTILLVSILLLYFILAAQFESLIQPLFILIELPIAISGALIFLYFGGGSINLMSMIGIVVMSGLVINDSILKIDAINQLRKQGIPLMQAIFEGGHKRLRPILMISFTSIGVLCPTLFMQDLGSELQKPLVLTLIGGMIIGLLVSLFFVPIIYWWLYKNYEKYEK
jgi:multidrug efflux pump subunit AcrB